MKTTCLLSVVAVLFAAGCAPAADRSATLPVVGLDGITFPAAGAEVLALGVVSDGAVLRKPVCQNSSAPSLCLVPHPAALANEAALSAYAAAATDNGSNWRVSIRTQSAAGESAAPQDFTYTAHAICSAS